MNVNVGIEPGSVTTEVLDGVPLVEGTAYVGEPLIRHAQPRARLFDYPLAPARTPVKDHVGKPAAKLAHFDRLVFGDLAAGA